MEEVIGALTGLLAAAVPLAVGVTKGVDLTRNLVDPSDRLPKATWNIAAFAFGILLAIGWQFNIAGGLADVVPALANSTRLDGVAGQLLTGVAIGAMSSFWHEKLDQWSSSTKTPA